MVSGGACRRSAASVDVAGTRRICERSVVPGLGFAVTVLPLDHVRELRFACRMDATLTHQGRFARFAAWLMLVALAARLASPHGWMPDLKGVAAGSSIVICSSYGPQFLQLDADGNPVPADHDGDGEGAPQAPCSFPLLAGLVEPSPTVIVEPLVLSGEAVRSTSHATVLAKRRLEPFGARSPPLA